jgi:hypothetical protein
MLRRRTEVPLRWPVEIVVSAGCAGGAQLELEFGSMQGSDAKRREREP